MLIKRHNDGSIFISQKTYVEKFDLETVNPVFTSTEKDHLTEEAGDEMIDTLYIEGVGCLLYLAVVTDVSYVMNYASQFLKKPGQNHWALVKRIFKYIKGIRDLAFVIMSVKNLKNLKPSMMQITPHYNSKIY